MFWAEDFWAPGFWREGFWVGIGSTEGSQKGGSSKGKQTRYILEVDGEFFPVSGPEEAEELLLKLRELAEEAAQKGAQSEPPKVRIKFADGRAVQSKTINNAVASTQQIIDRSFALTTKLRAENTLRDQIRAEVVQDLEKRIRDEYEALIALLL